MGGRRRILGLGIVIAMVSTVGSADADGLRILTYNTAFVTATFWTTLPPPAPPQMITLDFNEDQFGMDYEDRAHRIADAVLKADDDIVIFNEVFSDEAREVLVDRLKARYPSYISRVEGEAPVEIFGVPSADSGLMLFSRYPFLELDPPKLPPRELPVAGSNRGAPWGNHPFHAASVRFDCAYLETEFLDTRLKLPTADCLASKGAALVRIDGPEYVVTAVFTHLQASYSLSDSVERGVRDGQLADIRRLIVGALKPSHLRSQNQTVVFAGDLNVRGSNHEGPTSPDPEWEAQFDSEGNASSGFFARGDGPTLYPGLPGWTVGANVRLLADAWGFETSPDDPGASSPADGDRLDYFFYKQARALCVQHTSLAYDLHGGDGSAPLSDHLGLRADVNRPNRYCSPRLAGRVGFRRLHHSADVTFGPGKKAGISHGGSMQWFRIEVPGAYSISVDNENVGFVVYKADDLSRPIPPYHEETTRLGDYYALYDPPYYVRTFGVKPGTLEPDREATGEYIINFHKHQCTGPFDFCALEAGQPVPFVWPDNPTIAPDQKFWFKFYTDTSEHGEYPEVSFLLHTSPFWHHEDLTLTLVGDDGTTEVPFADREQGLAEVPGELGPQAYSRFVAADGTLDGKDDGPRAYYVLAERDPLLAAVAVEQYITFETELTYIQPIALKCFVCAPNQDGKSVVRIDLNTDLSGPAPGLCAGTCSGLLPVPIGGQVPLGGQAALHRRFISHARPRLLWSGLPLDSTWGNSEIDPLSRWSSGVEDSGLNWFDGFVWRDGPNGDEASYWYSMHYRLAHEAYYFDP